MEVLEKDGGIIFLRRLREGPTAESYGIHVARLAGLSPAVLDRADEIMSQIRGVQGSGFGVHNEQLAISNEKRKDNIGSGEWGVGSREEGAEGRDQIAGSKEQNDIVNLHDEQVNKDVVHEKVKSIVDNPEFAAVLRDIRFVEPNKITPLEALGLINEWKGRLAGHPFETHANGDTVEPPVNPPAMNKKPQSNKDTDSTPSLFD